MRVLFWLFAAALAGGPAEAAAAPAGSDTLIYCSEASPDYFNPQMSLSGAAFDASNLLYSRLLEFDEKKQSLIPGLARRHTLSKDKKTYTLRLREGVQFAPRGGFKPSRPFSADDVLFTFLRQKDKAHPFHQTNGGGYKFFKSLGLPDLIAEIKKIDSKTAAFILKKPQPLFPQYLAMEFANILSAEYGAWLAAKGQKEKIDFEPVGTGPFILERYVKGSLIRYRRNDSYYMGPAKLKKIIFAITPDPTVRFQKLKRGECHLAAKPQPLDIPAMKKHKGIRVIEGPVYNLAYLGMNTSRPPLNNPLVRKAIAHALNRPFYIKAIYKGLAEIAHTPVPPSLKGHNSKIRSPEYSIKKARELLKKAGHEKGFKIELWTLPVSRPYNPSGKKMGELMQADLKKIGIEARLVTYDWPAYIAKSSKGEHELIQMGWTADIGDPSNFLHILLSSQSVDSGANLSRWRNKNYDQLVAQAMAASPSKKAERLYLQAQEVFSRFLPFLPLVHAYGFAAASPRLKGYHLPPFGSERFYHLHLDP